jgi:outer membrane biosynthesis protein TonB
MRTTARAALGLLLSAGCASRQRPPVAVPAIIREGVTSVRVLEAESAKTPPAEDVAERITPAFASDENKLPVYPAHALEAGCQQGVVPVRVYVGTDGNVASIRSIPDRPVPDDQCHIAFSAATYAAVLAWRFAPAFRQTPKPGRDIDGDGRPDLTRWEQTPIMIYLDFEFTFRVVEGKGEVLPR